MTEEFPRHQQGLNKHFLEMLKVVCGAEENAPHCKRRVGASP